MAEKAFLMTERDQKIPCLFNPTTLSVSRENTWEAPSKNAGGGVKTIQYTGAKSGDISLTLFFDTTDTGEPVTTYTSKLLKLMEVDTSLPGSSDATQNARPPWVTFNWGSFTSYKAVIRTTKLDFKYFSSAGVPLRAEATLTLQQYMDEMTFAPQNPTSGTPFPHRTHRVQPGETLDRISAIHFGDPTMWRRIADANGIEDPLALRPGSILAIPELH